MARFTFGGFGGDLVVQDPSLNANVVKAAPNLSSTGTFWSAQTGGTQYTDLVDPNNGGIAISGVSTDAHGRPKPFQGPSGIAEGWLDFGAGRFKVTATDANFDSRITTAQQTADANTNNKVDRGTLVISVKDPAYGAKGDGTTNDTAAVNAAKAALGSKPGVIFFPPGDYVVDGLDFSMFANVELRGVASKVGGIYSNGSGNAASRLLSTATTGYGIKVDGGYGFTMRDLSVVANSSSFTGRLLDFRQVAASTVTGLVTLDGCLIAGNATNRAGTGVDLDGNVQVKISRCTVVDFNYGISGADIAGKNFSNVVTLEEMYFQNNATAHIHNPNVSWLLKGCTWEGLANGQAGAVLLDSGVVCEALAVVGGWTGDVTSTTASTHFNFLGNAYGVDFAGVCIGGTSHATGINFGGSSSSGIDVHGCAFDSLGTALTAVSGVRGHVGPNTYKSMSGINVTAPDMTVTDQRSVTTWVPTWTAATANPTNGGISAIWKRSPGKMIDVEMQVNASASTTFGTGAYSLSLPVAAASGQSLIGEVQGFNSGVAFQVGIATLNGPQVVQLTFHGSTGNWSPTVPWTFKNGDYVRVRLRYEEA